MFNFFKKKKEEGVKGGDEVSNENNPGAEVKAVPPSPPKSSQTSSLGGSSADLVKAMTEIDRLKASVESFGEVRKATTERLSGLSEQIGELRAMIMDRDRTIQEIELKAIKAADMVETVQPEKLMVEVQKEDAKFEALKANLEGNEAIMNRIMEELRDLRKKFSFFRGVEEVIKLSEEVKKELVEIKKVEGNIQVNADKVSTIYSELRKKYQSIDIFNDSLQELKVVADQNSKDVDTIKLKISDLAAKGDLDKLVQKVQRYIMALKELNKSTSLTKDVSQLKDLLDSMK